MLHEVLLALSGHASPLFEVPGPGNEAAEIQDLLSPSEAALLESIGKLAEHHRRLREHARWLASWHASTVCRAVATSITQTHLARFQERILDIESKILRKDATVVGAYDIVPLATVVAGFDDWHRLMRWLWEIACLMHPPDQARPNSKSQTSCTGAALINELRDQANTGFPDIAAAAVELSTVAETAWLRQLAPWLIHGKLPMHGANDFFIQAEQALEDSRSPYCRVKELQPCFVAAPTAASILFIGKSLDQVRQQARSTSSGRTTESADLAEGHLKWLSDLALPITQSQLSRVVSAIRLSLSHNVLQHLLPMHHILRLLASLRRYFLLGQGEFALALVDQAEGRLQARQQSMGRLLQQDPVKAMQGLSIKDAELQQAMDATWKAMLRDDEDAEDDVLEFGMKHLHFRIAASEARPPSSDSVSQYTTPVSSTDFSNLLFPISARLTLDVAPPLNLFISIREAETYSSINAYLLALRRAQVRLSSLWCRTAARRDFPSPSTKTASAPFVERETLAARSRATRKIWASSSATLFLISETAAYFEGEVIKQSCDHFEDWIAKPTTTEDTEMSMASERSVSVAQRDPETLAAAHRAFLSSLAYALLLTDVQYTRELRSLLGNIDALIAYFHRLLDQQQKLDLERAASGGEASSYAVDEEQRMALELDRARKKVDSDAKAVVNRLRQLDRERLGAGRYLQVSPAESGGFEAWKGSGVERLLMKLDYGRMRDDAYDVV